MKIPKVTYHFLYFILNKKKKKEIDRDLKIICKIDTLEGEVTRASYLEYMKIVFNNLTYEDHQD